jgi:hypothetical protein
VPLTGFSFIPQNLPSGEDRWSSSGGDAQLRQAYFSAGDGRYQRSGMPYRLRDFAQIPQNAKGVGKLTLSMSGR